MPDLKSEGLLQRLSMLRLQLTRAASLAPDTLITGWYGFWILLGFRLRRGRGRRSVFTIRPTEERGAAAARRAAARHPEG